MRRWRLYSRIDATTFCTVREVANLTGDFGQIESLGTGKSPVPGNDLPRSLFRSGSYDEGNQYSMVTDAWQEVVDLGSGVTVN